jgi:predicted O-methyltransferase YrrM
MNTVLERILSTQTVTDGAVTLPLRHPDFPSLPVALDAPEGAFLTEIIRRVRPEASIEIGMAYGVSTLFICDALRQLGHPVAHTAIDPYQSTQWRGIGLSNVRAAGFADMVTLIEEPSEFVLPRLAQLGQSVDFAFVDGWHTFDQVISEFFYLDRMLRPGGVIAFDDADRRSVNRVIRYVINYPNYEVFLPQEPSRRSWKGSLRRSAAQVPGIGRLIRRDLLERDWDLSILGTCVALRKTAAAQRSSGWYADF